jgi:hypothetical protein
LNARKSRFLPKNISIILLREGKPEYLILYRCKAYKGVHGVVAKATGWRAPAQGSIHGCCTIYLNLWPSAHLLVTGSLRVMPGLGRFQWIYLLNIINVRGCRTPNRVFLQLQGLSNTLQEAFEQMSGNPVSFVCGKSRRQGSLYSL